MTNYYIYHIEGIKIGVTTDVPRRMKEQGFTEWEHLETHTCVYEVSDREQELQRQYGLPVDTIPYWQAARNEGIPMTEEIKQILSEFNTGKILSEEHKRNISKGNKGNVVSKETKRKLSEACSTTTLELDVLVIQDRLSGMSQCKLAAKHNITRSIVRRIIRNMNE